MAPKSMIAMILLAASVLAAPTPNIAVDAEKRTLPGADYVDTYTGPVYKAQYATEDKREEKRTVPGASYVDTYHGPVYKAAYPTEEKRTLTGASYVDTYYGPVYSP
ncbi:hypothetical protein BJ878DRAFT_575761 [Calycina marina]|uniref:Cuticle protein n=1 Tax=Calycina marina TaxID=1763456 RepID=A0A9P7Z303_9HELO|nr:hypothetical protein BJ878DRAFT_575761 [Calycina marina]